MSRLLGIVLCLLCHQSLFAVESLRYANETRYGIVVLYYFINSIELVECNAPMQVVLSD